MLDGAHEHPRHRVHRDVAGVRVLGEQHPGDERVDAPGEPDPAPVDGRGTVLRQHPHQVGLGAQRVEEGREVTADGVVAGAQAPEERARDASFQLVEGPLDDPVEDRLLVREVLVERPRTDPRRGRDPVGARTRETPLEQHGSARVEDPLDGGAGPFLGGPAPHRAGLLERPPGTSRGRGAERELNTTR